MESIPLCALLQTNFRLRYIIVRTELDERSLKSLGSYFLSFAIVNQFYVIMFMGMQSLSALQGWIAMSKFCCNV